MSTVLNVLYLVHDLSDPAVHRRVTMLKAGGAAVTLAGFRRGEAINQADGRPAPIELGRTVDGKFVQRLSAVGKAAMSLKTKLRGISRPDIIIGRNLEMLALANRARAWFGGDMPIVYECLDIHRLLLGEGLPGRTMRWAERLFGRNAALLMTSSPAFVREYFAPFGQVRAPVMLLQNKVLDLGHGLGAEFQSALPPEDGQAWKIGWFGALRCRKSLKLLAAFTRRMEGRFEVVLRGRPAYSEFDDFDGFVAAEPFLSFEGVYRNPDDLAAIYGKVHYNWSVDFFEEGLNSNWLLPNRLYEGCCFGAVPIAMRNTETGRFLVERHIGLTLDEPSPDALAALVSGIGGEDYLARQRRILMQDRGTWVFDLADCRALADRLGSLARPVDPNVLVEVAA